MSSGCNRRECGAHSLSCFQTQDRLLAAAEGAGCADPGGGIVAVPPVILAGGRLAAAAATTTRRVVRVKSFIVNVVMIKEGRRLDEVEISPYEKEHRGSTSANFL